MSDCDYILGAAYCTKGRGHKGPCDERPEDRVYTAAEVEPLVEALRLAGEDLGAACFMTEAQQKRGAVKVRKALAAWEQRKGKVSG